MSQMCVFNPLLNHIVLYFLNKLIDKFRMSVSPNQRLFIFVTEHLRICFILPK